MSAMKAKSANTSGSWMNWTLARERATNTAVNTMVPAAAKAGRQENAKKKANTKANSAARRSTAAVQRASSGARGRVRNCATYLGNRQGDQNGFHHTLIGTGNRGLLRH